MRTKYENIVVELAARVTVPFIFLFGMYVVAHGHYSPGGGFQGGAIMAASVMLLRLSLGKERSQKIFPTKVAIVLGAIGLIIYAGTGLITLFFGGMYLDYSHLPLFEMHEAELRYFGILFVEIGVAMGVYGVMITIFDYLTGD